jgi:glucokinase
VTFDRKGDYVVGLDFGGTKIALATADLEGRILEQTRIRTEVSGGALQTVQRAVAGARLLMARTSERCQSRCLGAGAVTPGIVREDRIDLIPTMPGWERLAIVDLLREGLELEHVVVANDVKAAGEAEARWGSLRGADPGLFISIGTGIAAALIVGGRVVRGAHGAAGEVGYSLRGVHDEAGAAQGRAPLEELMSGDAIGRRGSRLFGAPVSAAEVFALAETDRRLRFLVDESLSELAVHVANWCVLTDPARVAIGGGLMNSGELILAALAHRVGFAVPFPPEIVAARFTQDGALLGAVSGALEAVGRNRQLDPEDGLPETA